MKYLVTGSAGHLGEALMRTFRASGQEALGMDLKASPFTDAVGSITDRGFVADCMAGCQAVLHTATLHKPHVATHTRAQFVDTNVSGTLNLLEEALTAGISRFIFTSTTSTFGSALVPPPGEPAAWITEDVVPIPKNIYGVTKVAAENLCELFHRVWGLPCMILRTSRFFPEEDDSAQTRAGYADANAKTNEFLFRRVDVADVVSSHLLALERATTLGFGRYIISASSPFLQGDLAELRRDAPAVVRRLYPEMDAVYGRLGWRMFPSVDRVYVNARAQRDLGWEPRHDFASVLARLAVGKDPRSELAQSIGSKGYHGEKFVHGPYPVE
jgi:UDP-glucose 4-epimerase